MFVKMDTPISLLNSICIQNNTKPDYTLLSREGQVHLPTFTYKVQVNGHSEEASGQSKKKAKHLAAKKMIQCLLNDVNIVIKEDRQQILQSLDGVEESIETEINSDPKSSAGKQNHNAVPASTELGNPIGKLQEICMKKHWHPPIYEEIEFRGLPHERVFSFQCRIENMNLRIDGSGKSKKSAKREAADKMLTFLRKQHLDKVDEILDRIPKRDQQDGCFNLRTEIMAFNQASPNKNRIDEERFEQFFQQLDRQSVLEKISDEMAANNQHYLREYIRQQIINGIDESMAIISEVIQCKLIVGLYPEKSSVDQYQSLAELIGTKKPFENIPILSAYGVDDQIDRARSKAISQLFFQLIFFIGRLKRPPAT